MNHGFLVWHLSFPCFFVHLLRQKISIEFTPSFNDHDLQLGKVSSSTSPFQARRTQRQVLKVHGKKWQLAWVFQAERFIPAVIGRNPAPVDRLSNQMHKRYDTSQVVIT